jgi:hypothetical protein
MLGVDINDSMLGQDRQSETSKNLFHFLPTEKNKKD